MRARISIIGTDVLCECDSAGGIEDARIPLTEETLSKLDEWNRQYRGAVRSRDPSMLLGLGAGMFDWLDEAGWASGWTGAAGERVLEVAVDDVEHDAARGLLDLPWETLTRKGDFLAADDVQPFVVFRSIGRHAEAEPTQPTYRDLTLMFMAAAPEGLTELNYEAEEVAILGATKRLPVQVVVEESGCKDFLKDRLAQDGPFEVVHISCHGDVIKKRRPRPRARDTRRRSRAYQPRGFREGARRKETAAGLPISLPYRAGCCGKRHRSSRILCPCFGAGRGGQCARMGRIGP